MKTSLQNLVLSFVTAMLLTVIAVPAEALPITVSSFFDPSENTVRTSVSVDGLGTAQARSLGAFDLDFSFDLTKLNLRQVLLTGLLGVPDRQAYTNVGGTLLPDSMLTGEALTEAAFRSPGQVNVSVMSLLGSTFLDELQGSQVFLAEFIFDGVTQLTSAKRDDLKLDLAINRLSDGFGNQFESNTIRFSPLPNPATLALFGIGLLLLTLVNGYRKQASRKNYATELASGLL